MLRLFLLFFWCKKRVLYGRKQPRNTYIDFYGFGKIAKIKKKYFFTKTKNT